MFECKRKNPLLIVGVSIFSSMKRERCESKDDTAVELLDWKQCAVREIFIRFIIPLMNPFMALEVFKFEPRLCSVLKDDTTPEGQALWKVYFERYFCAQKNQEMHVWNYHVKQCKAILSKEDWITLSPVFDAALDYAGLFKDGYRKAFMWHWVYFNRITLTFAQFHQNKNYCTRHQHHRFDDWAKQATWLRLVSRMHAESPCELELCDLNLKKLPHVAPKKLFSVECFFSELRSYDISTREQLSMYGLEVTEMLFFFRVGQRIIENHGLAHVDRGSTLFQGQIISLKFFGEMPENLFEHEYTMDQCMEKIRKNIHLLTSTYPHALRGEEFDIKNSF
ncbi:MAG: hypothetical protein K2Q45_03195 [Nitrosomonas sp.]|nr:hypothetical protein [Nitrosomonas sp.]